MSVCVSLCLKPSGIRLILAVTGGEPQPLALDLLSKNK